MGLERLDGCMPERLTEADWTRIVDFANTPPYEREPEMLLPEDAEGAVRSD
jgi:hypothetical protein